MPISLFLTVPSIFFYRCLVPHPPRDRYNRLFQKSLFQRIIGECSITRFRVRSCRGDALRHATGRTPYVFRHTPRASAAPNRYQLKIYANTNLGGGEGEVSERSVAGMHAPFVRSPNTKYKGIHARVCTKSLSVCVYLYRILYM